MANSIDALVDLIRQPYVLDPGSLEFLFEESLKQTAGPVGVACAALAHHPISDVERENIAGFIGHAVRQESIRRAFQRAIVKMGRCPKVERRWLSAVLSPARSDTDERVMSTRAPAPVPVVRAPATVIENVGVQRLDLRDLSGSLEELDELINRLGALRDDVATLTIALGEFTYSSALAVIAQWILARGFVGRYMFVDTPQPMLAYLNNIRFPQALTDPEIVVSPNPMDWAVGLTRINRELSTEKVTDKIVDILTTFINPNPEDRSSLSVLISEMIENVHRHAHAPVDGFAVAQVYPQRLKMGITLVDAGIGVRKSFEAGQPSIPIGAFRNDEEFLRAAMQLHVTSKSQGHSGYGLFLLSEVVSRNRGTFLVASGNATVFGYRRAGKLFVESSTHRPWQGTIVSVIIDLTRNLPLNQVYKEMPLPEGMTDDDLFFD